MHPDRFVHGLVIGIFMAFAMLGGASMLLGVKWQPVAIQQR